MLWSYKQAKRNDYKRLTFLLIPSDEFENRNDDSDDSSKEECANEGGRTKWLAGREPKQTNFVGDDDERHLDALANPEGERYDQCLIFAAWLREAFLLAQNWIEIFANIFCIHL